jgi:hypothetical protein
VERGEAFGHSWFEQQAALLIAHWLDTCVRLWGKDHTANAIEHADALDKVDDGREQ